MVTSSFLQNLRRISANVRLQALDWPTLDSLGIKAWIHRDDEIPYLFNGNKFYKLYYNLCNAFQQKHNTVVSFGGAYSNHIHALAAAGHKLGFKTVGLIRGHQQAQLSPTLNDAKRWGMQLHFLSKVDYRSKSIGTLISQIRDCYGEVALIPEGGGNLAGVRGSVVLAQAIEKKMQGQGSFTLCVASGTGTTLAGIAAGTENPCLGISVLKGDDSLSTKITKWHQVLGCQINNWQLIPGYHHGGYAKLNNGLLDFMKAFERRNKFLLDPVYTAKLVWAIEDLAKKGFWQRGSRLVLHHSGGLQGRRGLI